MSMARHHAEWLSLVEVSGPFLSVPVLSEVFPAGLEKPTDEAEQVGQLRRAYEEWQADLADPAIHRAWARFILTDLLELPPDLLAEGQALRPDLKVKLADQAEPLRPDLALLNPPGRADAGKARLLVQVYPPGQHLERPVGRQLSPATGMMELLRATDTRLGLVTNGEQWMLVTTLPDESGHGFLPTGLASWYAELWLEERLTLQAFRSLLGVQRFFNAPDNQTLEEMLKRSAQNQAAVTIQLGEQVRRAVEVLIQRMDRVDRERGHTLLAGVSEQDLYNAALTVMMRLVFLFCAEERGLLLLDEPLYHDQYAVSTLRDQLRQTTQEAPEEALEYRTDAWCRLLATFRAVHGGAELDQMRLPAYGGHLFDPDRYPFLEGRAPGTRWRETPANPLPVDNRTVLHLLEALQLLRERLPGGGLSEARRLSYKALDIEQIGHVYEGLLDHTAKRAAGPVLGLQGAEVSLEELEAARARGEAALLALLEEQTGSKAPALKRRLERAPSLEAAMHLRTACENDDALYQRVLPYIELLRQDTFGRPLVIPAGSFYVTAGEDRRSSGTHYTPRSLTEPLTRYTLEPLVYDGPADGKPQEEWTLRPAWAILKLKVCDVAMGSGAFLVQAARYLSERLLEAWAEEEERLRERGIQKPVLTYEGMPARGGQREDVLPDEPEERRAIALRLICDRCLYGVDKNQMAVEMAKLSLWLVTLAKGRPFTFLDHALRWGDSLLGADEQQLQTWSLTREGEEEQQIRLLSVPVRQALETALRLRRQIAGHLVRDARDAEAKEQMLADAEEAMGLVRLGCDLLTASALAPAPRERARLRDGWRDAYLTALAWVEEDRLHPYTAEERAKQYEERRKLRAEADALLAGRHPFHWWLEFPEVFHADALPADTAAFDAALASAPPGAGPGVAALAPFAPGFHAFLSNPPFMGGQKITGALGDEYREYLVQVLASGQRGSADLCAYFFLRAGDLLRQDGNLGMLATNTIAQGDTREVGLDQLAAQGFSIYRAVPSRPWPGTASLEVAHLWIRRGAWQGQCVLDERPVDEINTFLSGVIHAAAVGNAVFSGTATATVIRGTPYRLAANAGKSFQGSNVLGLGFTMTPEEAQALIAKDPRNKDVLFPYLNGEDLNSRADQSPSRWVINFFDWPLEKAEIYPDCMAIVREKVKPERDRLADGDATARDRAKRWWQFARPTMNLYATIAGMRRVLVAVQTSKFLSISFEPTGMIYSHMTVVFALDDFASFAVLNASWHTDWILKYCSTLETRLRYLPTDGFETFPLPESTAGLEEIGEWYYNERQGIMQRRQEGLTKTYNRFHDPHERAEDIAALRDLHAEMDRAVALAYGWDDLDLGHGFHQTKQGTRFTISEAARQEALGRLLALNHQRYAAEEALGLHKNGGKGKKGTRRPASGGTGGAKAEAAVRAPGLFDEET
jgi:hypothetical protein